MFSDKTTTLKIASFILVLQKMKIFVIIYLALMFARLKHSYPILNKIQFQKDCHENWYWEVFSRAFLFRQKHIGYECSRKSLENKLRIEGEEKRQQKLINRRTRGTTSFHFQR